MNWRNIRVYNNSQNNAFEELVCQLVRQEKNNEYKTFIRKGTPDGGVECFWRLQNGKEYAWQAKYVFDIDSVLKQADTSYKTALKSHLQMTLFVVAIPFDLPDHNYERNGRKTKSALEKWEDKVAAWKSEAKKQNRNIEINLLNASELLGKLMRPENEGMRYYWFNNEEFTSIWFGNQLENTISDLGPRYSPEFNVQLEISKKFNYLRRTSNEYIRIQRVRRNFVKLGRNFANEVLRIDDILKHKQNELLVAIEQTSEELLLNGYNEMQLLPLENIEKMLVRIEEISDVIYNAVMEKLQKDFYNSEFYSRYTEFSNIIYEIKDLIKNELILLNNPIMLLYGEAGSGKSHLLADVCKKASEEGIPSVLILGDYFTSNVNPKEQIKQIFQCSLNYNNILGTLNAIGQSKGERIIFAIDALNEGEGSLIWPKYLNGIVTEMKRFPWIAFVVSIRSDNMDEIVPDDCKKNMVITRHAGFEDCVEEACDNFFKHYGINFSIPILVEEFSNALYLKLFCETFENKRELAFLPSISDVFNGYLKYINKKLAKVDRFQYEESLNLVDLCVQKIALKMISENTYSLKYKDALQAINEGISLYYRQQSNEYKNFLDALIKENIFKCGTRYGQEEKYVMFSYERMGDYFVLYYCLKEKNEEESLKHYINSTPYFENIFETNRFGKTNTINMLSILLPEVYGTELLYCCPEGPISGYIIKGFLKSLIWRKNRTVDQKIFNWLRDQSLKNEHLKLMVIDEILPLCSLSDSSFNSVFIHENFLVNEKTGKRDLWWNTHINECYERFNPFIYRRIITWSWGSHSNQKLNSESRKLLGIILAWFCTSNNRELRDGASKGLVCIYKDAPEEVIELFKMFEKVEDSYVTERLFATMYGTVVLCKDKKTIRSISDYVLKRIFEKEEIIPHILIRDYALGIVKYALTNNIYEEDRNKEISESIEIPFRSKFPMRFPSQATIDKLEEKYKDNKAFSYVLSSLDIGTGYGDFGRYIFKNTLNKFDNIADIDKFRRWMIKRILKLGFNPELHDKDIPGYFGRRGGKTERIGKKYQWIAFYEIVARIADCYMLQPEWGEQVATEYLKGADELGVRTFDPTLLISNTSIEPYYQPPRTWYCDYKLLDAESDNMEWLQQPLEFGKNLIEFADNNKKWLALCSFPHWNEYRDEEEKEDSDVPKKTMYAQIDSFLLKKEDMQKWKKWNKDYPQESKSALQLLNFNGMFYKENYWNTHYEKMDSSFNDEGWRELIIDEENTGILYANTSQRHIWEEEYDFSKQDTIAFDIPTKIIINGMELQDSDTVGEYLKEGKVVCFNPGITRLANHLLLIDKEMLTEWLKDNDLSILWLVTIEKRIFHDFRGTGERVEWEGIFTIKEKELEGKMEKTES